MNADDVKWIGPGQLNLCPSITPVWLRLHRVVPRAGRDNWPAADDAIGNIAARIIWLAVINKVRPKATVHQHTKIGRRVVAVIKFLNGDDVRLRALQDSQCKRLVTLGVTVQVRRHDADINIALRKSGSKREKKDSTKKNFCAVRRDGKRPHYGNILALRLENASRCL